MELEQVKDFIRDLCAVEAARLVCDVELKEQKAAAFAFLDRVLSPPNIRSGGALEHHMKALLKEANNGLFPKVDFVEGNYDLMQEQAEAARKLSLCNIEKNLRMLLAPPAAHPEICVVCGLHRPFDSPGWTKHNAKGLGRYEWQCPACPPSI